MGPFSSVKTASIRSLKGASNGTNISLTMSGITRLEGAEGGDQWRVEINACVGTGVCVGVGVCVDACVSVCVDVCGDACVGACGVVVVVVCWWRWGYKWVGK